MATHVEPKTLTEEQLVAVIRQNGIPSRWQRLGMQLSRDGALSTLIVADICEARSGLLPSKYAAALDLLGQKRRNLTATKDALKSILEDYDANGHWTQLDNAATWINFDRLLRELQKDFSQHPFPVVLKSLEFNWKFMKTNGARAFYVMTLGYLDKIEQLTVAAELSIRREADTGIIEHYPLIQMDLASIEVPAHCDVCRMTITPLLIASGNSGE